MTPRQCFRGAYARIRSINNPPPDDLGMLLAFAYEHFGSRACVAAFAALRALYEESQRQKRCPLFFANEWHFGEQR